jgi:uncharacterized protein (TIGR02594 family)
MKELPWIDEGKKVFGLHETRDNAKLKAWLISDGKTLGDPKALPWCGDYVETAVKKALPKEAFTGNLAKNPYWARNWLEFGVNTTPVYGAVIVFSREKGGHVGFVVGEDETDYYVLGGNQSNAVTISRISKKRMLGTRWPNSFANPNRPLPKMTAGNIPRTTNEF